MAAKKGFFQKADKKKQYSDNVLNNVESAYRPKTKGRVKNPISSNTMSGEEPDTLEENVEQQLQSTQETLHRNPVGYAFAGPQAKRQKLEAQTEANRFAKVVAKGNAQEEVPSPMVFAAPRGFEPPAKLDPEPKVESKKRKTQVGISKSTLQNPHKLSQPEIRVTTGKVEKKLSQPEIRVTTGKVEKKLSQPEIRVTTGKVEKKLSQQEIRVTTGMVANELPQPEVQVTETVENAHETTPGISETNVVMEAMHTLEADVQESKGNYEPIQESELQAAKSLGLLRLFSSRPAENEMQYELEFDSISADEFDQSHQIEPPQPEALDGNALCMNFEADTNAEDFADTIFEIAAEAELFEEPLMDQASSAELGLSFEPQNYRKDSKKTQFLTVPTQGIRRSNRGTIEAVFQPNGKVVEAQYNRCGILIEVSVAGAMKLTRSAETGRWSMSYSDGSLPVNSVSNVAFDRLGNLCYSTEDGHTTVICADGRVVEK